MDWRQLPLLLVTLSGTLGYPDGPPESACVDMKPRTRPGVVGLIGHLDSSQNELPTYGNSRIPPYYIEVHTPETTYSPGQEIQVSIKANQTTGMVMYRGVLMEARSIVCASDLGRQNETIVVSDHPVGTFRSMGNNRLLKTMTCGDVDHAAVSHNSRQYKINETVTWVAPEGLSGHVIFRATIVQAANIYWMDVHSRILMDPMDEIGAVVTCGGTRVAEGYMATTLGLLTLLYYSTFH